MRTSGEFNPDASKSKLINLRLRADDGPRTNFITPGDAYGGEIFENQPEGAGRQEQLLRIAGWIDLESSLSVGCAGAVITYLQRRRAAGYLPGDENGHAFFQILRLETFSLKDSMFINGDTLRALQIVDSESHPNSQNQGPRSSGSKEGLSVYGLFHHLAHTPHGRQTLRKYFLHPTMDMDVLQERQRAIAVFMRPDNSTQADEIGKQLRGLTHMRGHMQKLKMGVSSGIPNKAGIQRTVWTTIRNVSLIGY